ncbi:MAG: type IV-A pilus assembly ATPase PilB [Bdellovibrionales bacterium]|nr:type IV-A pilus assembly ATPase PilB [Bdellovibrionales bacterium]
MSKNALGKLLVDNQVINVTQLEKAKNEQKVSGEKLTSILLRQGAVDRQTMREKLADMYGFPAIDLDAFDLDADALELMSAEQCLKHNVIPVSKAGSSLVVAFSDPTNIFIKDDIAFLTRCKIQPVVALEQEIQRAIEKYYGQVQESAGDIISEMEMVEGSDSGYNMSNIALDESSDPVIRFVNTMLLEAIKTGTSDIHVEPYEKYLRVRFRKDGQLVDKYRPPAQISAAIASRIKVMSRLDITEKRKPQDGRIKIQVPGKSAVDFRVSVLPTINGEKVVMRILDKSNLKLDLRDLGFEEDELQKFLDAIHRPQGLVLVTGPTGSGKTTTLYSALNELHDVTKNISTAEDPVEFNIEGINQVQVNPEIDFTFASALRSFLRQDPDIVLVGEIRDKETAEIAFQAASTGHMVLSTLHTNDATKTVDRLINMGVPNFLVTATVELILAQRLVQTICEACRVQDRVTPEVLQDLGVPGEEIHSFSCFKGAGCPECNGTGKRGRIAIYEVMPMTDQIRDAILTGATPLELRRAALAGGMTSLRQSGIRKVKKGLVSVQEVLTRTMKDPVY